MAGVLFSGTFQHTAARRRLVQADGVFEPLGICFNTQPPEGGWAEQNYPSAFECEVSTHSRPKAAGLIIGEFALGVVVSTHSRPKAAGSSARIGPYGVSGLFQHTAARRRLVHSISSAMLHCSFQHTAARRRLVGGCRENWRIERVSTHSRPKAAGTYTAGMSGSGGVSTHSRPKAAGFRLFYFFEMTKVSTHSRPKAAGRQRLWLRLHAPVSTHSRPKAAGANNISGSGRFAGFNTQPPEGGWPDYPRRGLRGCAVSTHSRPKAAGRPSEWRGFQCLCFNTQPPEGGWALQQIDVITINPFQHTAARRRLGLHHASALLAKLFQHTAARRRLAVVGACAVAPNAVSTHSRPKAAGASLKSLAPSGFVAPISLSS